MVLRLTLFIKATVHGETDTNLSDLRDVNTACVRCEPGPVFLVLEGELPGARYWVLHATGSRRPGRPSGIRSTDITVLSVRYIELFGASPSSYFATEISTSVKSEHQPRVVPRTEVDVHGGQHG